MSVVPVIAFLMAFSKSIFAGQQSFQNGNYVVEWTHLPATQEIEFNLTVKTTSWVGLGISKQNMDMTNLDVYAGGNNAGNSYMKDYYFASKSTQPSDREDARQSVTNIATSENDGTTVVSFRRLLNTGDAKDITITAGEKYYLAWAYGTSDVFDWHGDTNRGYSSGLVTLVAMTPSTITPTPTGQELNFKNGGFKLNWNFNSKTKEITFQITIMGTGWIGLGISDENSDMKNMDVAVASVNSSGHGTVEDYYSKSKETPDKDGKQDFTLVKASQDGGKTMVEFKRQLQTSDSKDLEIKVGKSYFLAWAYNPTSDELKYHGNEYRGYSSKVILADAGACAKLSSLLLFISLSVVISIR